MKKYLLTFFKTMALLCLFKMTSAFAAVELLYVESSSEMASVNVLKVVLEDFGYEVNITLVDVETMFYRVADGTADAMLANTDSDYFQAVKSKVDDLGPNLKGTKRGLVVPTYVTVDSIAELKAIPDAFNGQIIGIEPESGLMQRTETVISAYDMIFDNQFKLVEGNEASMIAALTDAISQNQWIVVTGWSPHWIFAQWPLKYLDDPLGIYGDEGYISTLARKGLKQDRPEVYKVLDNFHWTPADMQKVMIWNAEPGSDPYLNAKRWVRMNSDKVIAWTDHSQELQVPTYHVDTGQLYIPTLEILDDGKSLGLFKVEMERLPDGFSPMFELDIQSAILLDSPPISYGSLLKRVLERGKLLCGVRSDPQLKGFAFLDSEGNDTGFDIDLCRAVAAALFNDPNAVEFVKLDFSERGEALKSARVDMLSQQTTWTTARDVQWGDFTWIMFYEGQGFIVRADRGISTLEQLNGQTICVVKGTTSALNLQDTFTPKGLTYRAVEVATPQAGFARYEAGECTAMTSDKAEIAEARTHFADPNAHTILDITLSKEPLSPMVPYGDSQWLDLVKTVMIGLINAEELGITQSNIETMKNNLNPAVRRLLGLEGSYGQSDLGLKPQAIIQAIQAVGHYGELYERYLGQNGIGLERNLNRLWTKGGLLYAPPLR